jgi:hypothetical protein
MDPRGSFDDQGSGRRIIAKRIEQFLGQTIFPFLLFGSVDAAERPLPDASDAGSQLPGSGPFFRLPDDFPDQLNQDGALVASLEPKLTAQVAELSQGAATEAEGTATDTEIDLASGKS